MKKSLVTILSSSIILGTGITYAVNSGLSSNDKIKFVENIFDEKFNNYFFNETPNMLEVNGHKVGIFRANMNILASEVSLLRALEKVLKDSEAYYYGKKISSFSEINFIQKGKEKEPFSYIDHKFVKWATDNLYISPDTTIYNVKAKDIYNSSFQRFFRLTTESYLFLNKKKGFYKSEQKNYMNLYNESNKDDATINFFAPFYYAKYDTDPQLKPYVEKDYSYTPAIAISFWLRRGMDGSDKLLWQGLQKVMTNYDKEWFKKATTTKYNKK
ncbi:MAG: hypothetical protein U0354_00015 [Candidatus Sericytochromatia bacterium]